MRNRVARRALRAADAIGPSAIVLTYHRIADLAFDPQLLAVTPRNFAAQLELLRERFDVVPPASVVRPAERPGRTRLAITFDDGYADNLITALPLLAAAQLPATAFVASGYVASGSEFWWDELERIVFGAPRLPARVTLDAGGWRYDTSLTDEQDVHTSATWTVLQPAVTTRQRVYVELDAFVRPLSAAHREIALEQLRAAFGVPALARQTHRPLAAAEVARLDASPYVEVGAHSADHEVLSRLTAEELRWQIGRDKAALEEMCGREMTSFSYPYGGPADFSAATVRAVRDAGFSVACANYPGLVKPWTHRLRIPRFVIRDWDAATLSAHLDRWLGVRGSR